MKFDLQMFAETVQGKQMVYLFRPLANEKTEAATVLAFATENERTVSKDADTTITKSGTVRTPSEAEIEITATALLTKGDTLIDSLTSAMLNDGIVECWEVNMAETGTSSNASKYKAKYFQGYITELSVSSSAEESVEVSITYGVNGDGADGYATLTDAQQEAASYVFKDTVKVTS